MKNTIRNYSNTVSINFEKHHSDFIKLTNYSHYNIWLQIIAFLRKRGFNVKENPSYKKHYACLSRFHKIGFKNNVALLMEIGGNSIKVQFGNIKNLWTPIAQSFWDNPNDDRYTKLSYLEDISVKLEIYKLLEFCKKYNFEFLKEDSDLSNEEYIVNTLKRNPHIHGKIECLNDIKLAITPDSYNYKCNSNDKNNVKIICGEKKYFYDYYTKRLCCGIVWHNINNMWWVISGNKLRNIVSFELFDYVDNLPRKRPATEQQIERLLKKYEAKRDYQKCLNIQKHHKLEMPN